MGDSFLDMAISNLEVKLNLLKAIKETNANNDNNDSKTIITIFKSIQEGNQTSGKSKYASNYLIN